LFDAESAATFAETLSVQFPSRVPGSDGARDAAVWYRETISALALPTEEDVWSEDLADLGTVELRNIVTVVAGRSEEAIIVVAHRDNAGTEQLAGENARGTAALIELGRGYGPETIPQHTLVLLSTDAGAYGGAGAARFVMTSPLARDAIAAVVLDDLRGGRPRLAISGDDPVSPARALVRTAAARVAEETGAEPALPSVLSQLVALGIPYALEEQGRLLAAGLSAVTIGTDGGEGVSSGVTPDQRLGQLGRATEALVTSLDRSVGGAFQTPDSVFFARRAASGWTLRLALVLSVVPFALGIVDLLVRGRRRKLPFRPALRALRARLGFWLLVGVAVWIAALFGVLPRGTSLPLPPFASVVVDPPLLGLLVVALAVGVGWLVVREPLVPVGAVGADERLAGLIVALTAAGCVAVSLAVLQPYTLLFVLPSLYAWLWLPLEGRIAGRVGLYAVGWIGPVVAVIVLANGLELSVFETMRYAVGLATVGYTSGALAFLLLIWLAVAAQVGAVAFGRYSPYAGGGDPPPAGPLRRLAGRAR